MLKGNKIDISNLTLKKPGTGFNEKYLKKIINKTAKKEPVVLEKRLLGKKNSKFKAYAVFLSS